MRGSVIDENYDEIIERERLCRFCTEYEKERREFKDNMKRK